MRFDPILPPARVAAMKAQGHWRDRLLTDLFDARVAQEPDKLGVIDGNSMTGKSSRLTFRELAHRVDRLAAGLAALGVAKGDVVAWQLPNWWQFTALHLACLRIGAISGSLMPIFRERELSFMLGLAEAKVLVVPRSFRGFDHAAMARALRPSLPHLRHVLVIGGEGTDGFEALLNARAPERTDILRLFADRQPAPDDVIEVQYTSGTTGEPKGVMHTSNTLLAQVDGFVERLRLSSDDVVLMASPMAHQTGFLYGLIMPAMLGATAVLQDIWDPRRAAAAMAAERVTFTMGATPFLSDITELVSGGGHDVSSLRVFVSAGAPIPRALVERAGPALGAHIVSAWGMTENGAVTMTGPEDPPDKTVNTDGACLPGMEIKVFDTDGKALPSEVEGQLKVRGAHNFVGYLKRPQLYGHDEEGWFDTGDLARIDADGYVRITGRAKDLLIRGGENIPVVEIEGLLFRHPDVQEVAIVGMPDPRLGERACAFVVPRPGAKLSLSELTQFLGQHKVARQYLPERLELVADLPRTPSGKVQKFKLREMAKGFTPARAPLSSRAKRGI
ncbi:MAG TPA: cyclohexanecarboxylate-CoA ligase [Vineibacter sp.]|nr:cyclohexanecarboxylate-CoA ligase [Vineibacter sp.]